MLGSTAVPLERADLLLPSRLVAPPALGKAGGSSRESVPTPPPGAESGLPLGYAVASQLNAAGFLSFLVSSRKTRAGETRAEVLSVGKGGVWGLGCSLLGWLAEWQERAIWGLGAVGFALCGSCDQPRSK